MVGGGCPEGESTMRRICEAGRFTLGVKQWGGGLGVVDDKID